MNATVASATSNERLEAIFTARSVALVGASDNSRWSQTTFATATAFGFPTKLHLVNRRGAPAHGRPTATSCAAIGEPVDVAVLVVGADALPDAVRDAAEAGACGVVALAAGFAEAGSEGRAAQQRLVDLAAEFDVTLFGPNCLGFLNLVDRVSAWASPLPVPRYEPGAVALISQSGGITIQLGRFGAKRNVAFSHVVSTGNEAAVDSLDVAATLVEDERVRVLALFVETIRDAARFDAVTARADDLGKPVVMLKVGRTELAAQVIASHTGALAGDDRVIDAALRDAGVIRVRSLEQLVVTAGLAARLGRLRPGGLGVVSISGGACDVVVDAAAATGTELVPFAAETVARLEASRSAYGTVRNPLDVTGAAVGGPELMVDAVRAVAADPGVAVVAVVDALPEGDALPEPGPRVAAVGAALAELDTPCVLVHQVHQDLPHALARRVAELGVDAWVSGLDDGVDALGALLRWSARAPRATVVPEPPLDLPSEPLAEAAALDLLAAHGVPTVPHRLATTADEAVAAAEELGYPVVVKVSSAAIAHKSDVGGVVLDLRDADAVRAAFARVAAIPTAAGALVAPLRSGGIELIAGVVRDPQWGLVLGVGLGGIWVEAIDDAVLRRLPATRDDVRALLDRLRAKPLFAGVRGAPPADLDAVAGAIERLAALAQRLGPRLASIEVNPLRVDGSVVEALDAAIGWSEEER